MEFTITRKNNLSILIDELEALWCNARDDNAHNNCEDINLAIDAIKSVKLPIKIDLQGEIIGAQLPNFSRDFVRYALENAVERHDWQA